MLDAAVGDNHIDFGDGRGPLFNPDESKVFRPVDHTGLNYTWVNARGTLGLTYWNANLGRFETLILTGKNEGRLTALRRI